MDRTISEYREGTSSITFDKARVTIRIQNLPDSGTSPGFHLPDSGIEIEIAEAFNGVMEFDSADLEFRDANDPNADAKPPLGTAATRRRISLTLTGHAISRVIGSPA